MSLNDVAASLAEIEAAMDWEAEELVDLLAISDFSTVKVEESATFFSKEVWKTPTLRPLQLDVLHHIFNPSKSNSVLAVLRTGSGKTHTVRVAGVMMGGICVFFVPLLALSADTMKKFISGCDRWGAIDAYNVDELHSSSRSKYKEVLDRVAEIENDTTSSIFLFMSPHFLVLHPEALDVLLTCADKETMRLVVVDECHIHVQHGMTFRGEIRILREIFFRKVFHPKNGVEAPTLICLTATLPNGYEDDLSSLITVRFDDNNTIRASPNDFDQPEIEMRFSLTAPADFSKHTVPKIAAYLQEHPDKSAILFCNSRFDSIKLAVMIEEKLDLTDSPVECDCLVVNGAQQREEKFHRVRIFCESTEVIEGMSFRALVSTNAINVGLDKETVDLVVRKAFPRDLATAFQERGRGSRKEGDPSVFHLHGSLSSYEFNIKCILEGEKGKDKEEENTPPEMVGLNSAISPMAKRTTAPAAEKASETSNKRKDKLSPAAVRRNKARAMKEQKEVTRFFCENHGCWHVRSKYYMALGRLEVPIEAREETCGGKCAVCSGDWQKLFMPVYKSSLVSYLDSHDVIRAFPQTVAPKIAVSDVLWKDKSSIKTFFDRAPSGVKRSNADAVFLSLASRGILDLERTKSGEIRWNLLKDERGALVYKNDKAWDGINVHPEERKRKRTIVFAEDNNNYFFYL